MVGGGDGAIATMSSLPSAIVGLLPDHFQGEGEFVVTVLLVTVPIIALNTLLGLQASAHGTLWVLASVLFVAGRLLIVGYQV